MQNNVPLISVVVASYNHAEYLDQRMESLLCQTYPNLEIIVVDDCSKDDSLLVLEKYKKYPHVRVIALEKNGGYAATSNLGVSLSRGEYIMFAECDDFNAPAHIETLYNVMADNEQIGVAYCRSHMVDSSGDVFDNDFDHRDRAFRTWCLKDTVIPKKMMRRFLLASCVIPNMSAALIRKECFELSGRLSSVYKTCADWDLWLRMSQQCDFYYTIQCLNHFRTHGTSVRSIAGMRTSFVEIMAIVYTALRATEGLTFWERFRVKVGLGRIWGRYRSEAPLVWLKNCPFIWSQSFKYDKLSLFYFMSGFLQRVCRIEE